MNRFRVKLIASAVTALVLVACRVPVPQPSTPDCVNPYRVDGLVAAQSQPHPREWPSGWHGDGNAGTDGTWTWCENDDDD